MKNDRYIKLLLLLFFLLSFSVQITFGQSYPYKFNYITVDEGLSHTDANDIAQDKKGFIWIATNFGLDRYDGYTIKKYYNSNVPIKNASKNRVVNVTPDNDGQLWLSCEDGLQRFDVTTEKYIDYTIKGEKTGMFLKVFKAPGDFLFGYVDGKIKRYLLQGTLLEEQPLKAPSGEVFCDMVVDKTGALYFAGNTGIWTLTTDRTFKKIPITGFTGAGLFNLFFDRHDNLLITIGNKVLLINKNAGAKNLAESTKLNITKEFIAKDYLQVIEVAADDKSDYWVNTGSSLLRLDRNLNYIQTVNNKNSQTGLNSNLLIRTFIDRSQCLWVGTFGGGVNYCDLNQKLFYTLKHDPGNANSLSGSHIRAVTEDGDNLWVGTNADGLNLYNFKTQAFKHFNAESSSPRIKSDMVTALCFDGDHNLWIGTSAGIEILKPNLSQLWQPAGYQKFPGYIVESIARDCYGNMWFGNHDTYGVIFKDRQNNYQVKQYKGGGHFILADRILPRLFISSRTGLQQITISKQGDILKTVNYQASDQANTISSSYTSPVRKQNDSTYWVGTIGGGLNKLTLHAKNNTYTINLFGGKYGVFNDVEGLEIDNNGKIWIGGNALQNLDPLSGKLISYDKSDGLQGNSFKVRGSYKGASGRLYFGGINGLNYFYPDQIKANRVETSPALTDILINNEEPAYGDTSSSANKISQAIIYNQALNLSYLQNNFVISFSAMHFANPLKCRYRYKLIGFDKDWRYANGKNPTAAYNNLDYANYQFVVEATNNDGLWSKTQAGISITVTPPWWKSTPAKCFYALLFLSALAGIYIYQARWYRLKREIAIREVNEKKREEMHAQSEEMHQQKEALYQQQITFFTNISHEFRTPLTLILGPLERLADQNKDSGMSKAFQPMIRNAKRLVNLISELMNYKKVSDSLIKLKVRPLQLHGFCEDIAAEFQNLADVKNIRLDINFVNDADLNGIFDAEIIEKIIFNLLNNAFKYTAESGNVLFSTFTAINTFTPTYATGFKLLNEQFRANRYVYFHVKDTGIGISPESISDIFERYYRISNDHLGSGIGLALVKSLVKLHKGDIYVYSERHKGTEIIIGIPVGDENYTEQEKNNLIGETRVELEPIDNTTLMPLPTQFSEPPAGLLKGAKRILLVEDNDELRAFLKQTLQKDYHIYEAIDGNTALQVAAENVPDLIISDVMMPGMNGIEFCKMIKEQFETSHVPFIILSAKDALDTKLEGMKSGADYYFAKPLSIDLLQLTIRNIFDNAEKLKQHYVNDYLSEATELVHTEKDKEFLQRLLNLIEDSLTNADLDVDFLCNNLYISRTKLYQKIKSISNQSVGEFIRTIRLKKAIQIMTHEDVAMNEVVERVGLQSSSNFSRVFKKEYGKSPIQFMQSLRKTGIAQNK